MPHNQPRPPILTALDDYAARLAPHRRKLQRELKKVIRPR
jgi:hypothetical protein